MIELCSECHLTYDVCNCNPTGLMPGDLWHDDASYARYQSDPGGADLPELTPEMKFLADYHPYQFNTISLPEMFTYPTWREKATIDPNWIPF